MLFALELEGWLIQLVIFLLLAGGSVIRWLTGGAEEAPRPAGPRPVRQPPRPARPQPATPEVDEFLESVLNRPSAEAKRRRVEEERERSLASAPNRPVDPRRPRRAAPQRPPQPVPPPVAPLPPPAEPRSLSADFLDSIRQSAQRAALTYRGPSGLLPQTAVTSGHVIHDASGILAALSSPESIRRAIVLNEILRPPPALRRRAAGAVRPAPPRRPEPPA